jgi:ankyrin repeat protein
VDDNGTPAVVLAEYSDNADSVEALVEGRPEVANQQFTDPRVGLGTPLAVAVVRQKTEFTRVLIKAGADVNWVNSKGTSFPGIAVVHDDLGCLRMLVDAGADVKKPLEGRVSLVNMAALGERPEMIAALIGYGVDPNLRDDTGVSPLQTAAGAGNIESARVLLEHGAWSYTMSAIGETPLSAARRRISDPVKSEAMVQLLLQHGAPADGNDRPIDTAYLDAVIRGDLPAVKAALAKGADIDARRRMTVKNIETEGVSIAVEHPDVLAYLIEHGIYLGARSTFGLTALHYAASHEGNLQSIRLLVDHGLDVNVKSRHGETPLGRAVNANKPAAVELLLKLGADPHARGIGGTNLLDLARNPNHSALLVPMLEKASTTTDPHATPKTKGPA